MVTDIRLPIILSFLLIFLGISYFSIHYFVQNAQPGAPSSFDRIEVEGSIAQFDLKDLEIFIQGRIERARSGKSISHKEEKVLKEIRAVLALHSGGNSGLVAKLIAMIDEILELNRESIHLEDGEHQTDDN